jgi:hypothetical protein
MCSATDVKVVHLIMQSSPTDRTTKFTLLQRKKDKTLGQLSSFDEKRLTNLALEPSGLFSRLGREPEVLDLSRVVFTTG